MPLIQPPPAPPKKQTIAVRLDEATVSKLRLYGAYAGTRNYSYIVAGSLDLLFKADNGFEPWCEVHPNFTSEKKRKSNRFEKRSPKGDFSGAPAPSLVVAADAARNSEV